MKFCVCRARPSSFVWTLAAASSTSSFSQTQNEPQLNEAVGTVIRSEQPFSDVVFTRKGERAFFPFIYLGVGGYQTRKLDAGFSSAGETLPLPGYTLLNLNASTRLSKEWTLLALLGNAAGKVYESISTYATPGRSVYVGVKWSPQ